VIWHSVDEVDMDKGGTRFKERAMTDHISHYSSHIHTNIHTRKTPVTKKTTWNRVLLENLIVTQLV
jgi:hypothetical protein